MQDRSYKMSINFLFSLKQKKGKHTEIISAQVTWLCVHFPAPTPLSRVVELVKRSNVAIFFSSLPEIKDAGAWTALEKKKKEHKTSSSLSLYWRKKKITTEFLRESENGIQVRRRQNKEEEKKRQLEK